MTNLKYKCLTTHYGEIPALTFMMKVKDVLPMYYVAIRGKDSEEGAVQRVLNTRRIASIKTYVLDGNTFFSSFVMNWTNEEHSIHHEGDQVTFPLIEGSMQVIDGQHRLAGLQSAYDDDKSIGELDILVTLCSKLTTKQAAKILLNINTEQKPVPKSLIYDLFGELEDEDSHAINRITDISRELNESADSPFYKQIKFPGAPRGVGSLELSTIVQSLKEHIKPNGTFSKFNIKTYDNQRILLNNYFGAIKYYYDEQRLWSVKSKNPFLKSAGFSGSIDFLSERLISKCVERKCIYR